MSKGFINRLSNIYIFIIAASIFPVLFFISPHILHSVRIYEILFWMVLEIAADLRPIQTINPDEKNAEITMSFAVQLCLIILFGTNEAAWIVIVATLIAEMIIRRPLHRALFNAGQYGLCILASGHLFHLFKLSPKTELLAFPADIAAILIAFIVYFLLNAFLISAVISLTSGNRFKDVFMIDFKLVISYFFTLVPISIGMSLIYIRTHPYIVLFMAPPILMTDLALRRLFSLQHETQETLKVLANTIDARDGYTAAHSTRVAEYAKKIAVKLDLPVNQIEEIEMAGLVHDLGKVAVEDRILRKDGKLNDEEFTQIKRHPEVAYNLLKNLKPYKNGALYVLYHHERFNGGGYPRGISGSSIPLGARILTVSDSYDAMTSDRTYRKALSQHIAVSELLKGSGTQFDPAIVSAFVLVLKSDYGYKEE